MAGFYNACDKKDGVNAALKEYLQRHQQVQIVYTNEFKNWFLAASA